uniref:Interferon alpha and beta receptor subunit 2 n=1 Tax=Zonotrichia albicollis TaxID=44394 RepID=A0A8D2MLN2_ZONAL
PRKGLPYNLQIDSHNFQHILSWQAEHDPAVPASYNVLYKDYSQDWMSAQQCSGIAQLSCELTEEFKAIYTEYSVFVQSTGGAQLLNSSLLRFVPFTETILGPPEVNVTSCPNCLNVTIKLPASHFRQNGKLQSLIDIYQELDYDITLKSQDGEHKVGKFGNSCALKEGHRGHEMALVVNRLPKPNMWMEAKENIEIDFLEEKREHGQQNLSFLFLQGAGQGEGAGALPANH